MERGGLTRGYISHVKTPNARALILRMVRCWHKDQPQHSARLNLSLVKAVWSWHHQSSNTEVPCLPSMAGQGMHGIAIRMAVNVPHCM